MKVIFITREGYNLAGGRVRSYNFAKELAKYGIDTRVLSYSDNLGAKDGIDEGTMGFVEKLRYNLSAYEEIKRERDAILIVQRVNYHIFAPLLSRILRGNRIVLDMDDWEMKEDPRYIWGFYPTSKAEWLTRRMAALSCFCITGSLYLKGYLGEFNKKTHYIPSCVDIELFRPRGSGRKDHDIVKFAWIGTMHRLHDAENIRFMIDAFEVLREKIKDVSLDIVGDGIYRDTVISSVVNSRYRDNIKFIGWIAPEKMPGYLESIDVGLLPLIQNTRFNLSKSPVKLFEYMAMEKPSIASLTGEAGEIIEEGKTGFLADSKAGFVKKMEILTRDIDLRINMGKNARKTIENNYSLKIAGKRLSDAFKGL